eukprot:s853_g10.t1
MTASRARRIAWRCFSGGTAVLGVGLAVRELQDTFFQEVQVDDRAQLLLGLDQGLLRARREREQKLRDIMGSADKRARAVVATAGDGDSAQALLKLRAQLVEEAHRVMYPSLTREEVDQRRRTFGNVKWTEAALQLVERFSPLVEVGAGEGQWQSELRRRGADVTAFDDHSSPSRFGEAKSSRLVVRGADVQQADAEEALGRSRGRTLLLVYPPPGPMAMRCLASYTGDVLLYVGEGRGGVNADGPFFDALSVGWTLEEAIELDTLPGSYEKLYLLRRSAG